MARAVKAHGYPMVLNFVLHRHNIDQIDRIIELCIELEADDVELATCQFYGWAQLNREGLLPTREQIARAEAVVGQYRERMAASGSLTNLLFVTPDYYEERPKGCMGGWGAIFLSVTPEGTALPCHSARQLPVQFPSVLEQSRTISGTTRSASTAIAASTGCRNRAAPATKREGFRRLPLSGLYADRQRGQRRSGLRQIAAPRQNPCGARTG